MMLHRRTIIAALAALALGGLACAQDYPSRPITVVVPFPAGGGVDLVARQLAEQLATQLGQRVIVENKAGAGGNVAAEYVARAEPDGYTILASNLGILSVNPYLYARTGFDAKADFVHLARTVVNPLMLVVPKDAPAKTLGEFVARAKEKPGALNYGSGGVGNINHLAVELLLSRTGTKIQHVPFRGSAPALNELVANRIDFMLDGVNVVRPFVEAGTARALLVTSADRIPAFASVPNGAEAGIQDFVVLGWQGLAVPAKTPKAIVARLEKEIRTALETSALNKRLTEQGSLPSFMDSVAFTDFIDKEQERWSKVVKETGAKAE